MKDILQLMELVKTTNVSQREADTFSLVGNELARAQRWPAMNSAHEGYAVLLEEVDELWEHVKVKQGERDVHEMAYEAIQVAAMAIRFVVDVCTPSQAAK